MSTDDGGLSRFEHDEMRDLVLAGTQRIRPAGNRLGHFVGGRVLRCFSSACWRAVS